MSHNNVLNLQILSLITNIPDKTILDVACGFGDWGFLIRSRKKCLSIAGLDIWRPHLYMLKNLKIYDRLIQAKIPFMPFKEKSFDISFACEILEHLSKEDGNKLLSELERVTKGFIIVSVPVNLPQKEAYGNPYEEHVCEWSERDFSRQGYTVIVVNTIPKTLRILDRMRRLITRLPPTPKFIIAQKFLRSQG